MAQSIQIAGASYPDVPSIVVPKVGSGTAVFADPSGVTAVAADVASGKLFLDSSGALIPGTASGGGGASNVVTGTFKGTTTDAAMDVTLNYSGTGYPIAVMIFPSATDLSTFNDLIQRYAIRDYFMDKEERTVPSYSGSGNADSGVVTSKYKNSTSNATSYADNGTSSISTKTYNDTAATASASLSVRIRSATKMSVFIASTSYGFAANIEYTYWVIYSS